MYFYLYKYTHAQLIVSTWVSIIIMKEFKRLIIPSLLLLSHCALSHTVLERQQPSSKLYAMGIIAQKEKEENNRIQLAKLPTT